MRRAFGIGGAAALVALGIIWSIAASGPTAGPARLGRSGDNCSGQACRVASLTANNVTAASMDAGTVRVSTDLFLTAGTGTLSPTGGAYGAWLYFPTTTSVELYGTGIALDATETGGTITLASGADISLDAPLVTLSATNQDVRWTKSTALSTCNGSTMGATRLLSATASNLRTRLCLCTSNNAGSPAYAWQNIASDDGGTGVGDATSCP